jgi:hypothetical protein
MLPKTLARDLSPLEILATQPRSDVDNVRLMLIAFGLMSQPRSWNAKTVTPPDLLEVLVLDLLLVVNRPKGIPTPQDEFALQLLQVMSTPSASERLACLQKARSLLVTLNRQFDLDLRRHRSRSSGGGRKRGSRQATLGDTVLNVKRAKPELFAVKKRSALINTIANRTRGYASLSPKQQKNRRDEVRKFMRGAGLFAEAVKPLKRLASRASI